ncbi:MAG TPA: hypothetical protein VFA77_03220 [Candidatus Eisenbacteria bacterium]|nr:hypothetical protein [Candidatus Eisenbacteria bacterium]
MRNQIKALKGQKKIAQGKASPRATPWVDRQKKFQALKGRQKFSILRHASHDLDFIRRQAVKLEYNLVNQIVGKRICASSESSAALGFWKGSRIPSSSESLRRMFWAASVLALARNGRTSRPPPDLGI